MNYAHFRILISCILNTTSNLRGQPQKYSITRNQRINIKVRAAVATNLHSEIDYSGEIDSGTS